MSWLSGWGKRIKLTLDHLKVDEDLVDFPLMIHLSNNSGRNNADLTDIFDELLTPEVVLDDDCEGNFSDNWIDKSNKDSMADFNNGKLRLVANSSSSSEGCNALTKQYWPCEGIYKIEFDWWPVDGSGWYDDDFTDAQNLIKIVRTSPSYNDGGWQYNRCESGVGANSYLMLALRSNKSNRVNIKQRVNGTESYILNEPFSYGSHHRISWIIDFNLYITSLYIDDNLIGGSVSWDPNLLNYIGDHFKLNFHWHTYGRTATQLYDNISSTQLYSGYDKKIAIVADHQGESEMLYTEIESWDWVRKEAYLWAKVPTVYAGSDTTLYLYYDSSQLDNDNYVGYTGELVAKKVWDFNYAGVWHLSQKPSDGTGCILDSASNNNGTPEGSMTSSDLVYGQISKALYFDGTDDYIKIPINLPETDYTYSLWIKTDTVDQGICRAADPLSPTSSSYDRELVIDGSGNLKHRLLNEETIVTTGYNLADNNWHFIVVFVKSGVGQKIYIDGEEAASGIMDHSDFDSESGLVVGGTDAPVSPSHIYFNGLIDEVRIENIPRSVAWITATYYSMKDNLISFGQTELEPKYYYHGFVKEHNLPVSRTVRLYYRNTGELIDETTSRSSDGYYYLTTSISGEHFIVAFDDDVGENFNALVLDKLMPRGKE